MTYFDLDIWIQIWREALDEGATPEEARLALEELENEIQAYVDGAGDQRDREVSVRESLTV